MSKAKEKPAQPWPADNPERRKVSALIPYAKNSRKHSPAQVDQIANSIREWGWTIPVLCDEDGGIIAGHGRVMAAQQLGIDEVPVLIAKGWTEAQKRAYVIADNKLPEMAEWDHDLLTAELGELAEIGFDIELTGFDLDVIEEPEPPAKPKLKNMEVLPPPKRAWMLIGIPLERWEELATLGEKYAADDAVILETTVGD